MPVLSDPEDKRKNSEYSADISYKFSTDCGPGLQTFSLHFFGCLEVDFAYLPARPCIIPLPLFFGLFWRNAITNFVTPFHKS